MFTFLDNRIIDPFALQNTEVVQNADGTTYDVVAHNLPSGSQILKNFADEDDANAFVTRIQNELASLDTVAIVDVRTPA